MKWYTYDLETLPNFFSFAGKFLGDNKVYTFEMSDRKNERDALLSHLSYIQNTGALMVGYNSIGFDYPILHSLLLEPYTFTYQKAYLMCRQIIESQNYGSAGSRTVYLKDRIVPQLDLVKINHFDNKSKRTSLKAIQFAMRSDSVEDLPYPYNQPVTHEQMDHMLTYNVHDITETERFLVKCMPAIEMRENLLKDGVLGGDVLNYSDVKIGIEYFIKKIGRSKCFVKGSTPRQSIRSHVEFKNIILPKISFRTEPYQEVLKWFNEQELWIEQGARPKLQTKLAGLDFHFGIGGIHASVESKVYNTNGTHMIKDVDVTGMYPAVAIANGFAPEHLGQDFVTAYRQLVQDRKQYPKGTTMNAVLKLASNGVYGNSNNPYSPFYDPKYMLSVTVNGQLQLLQLVEYIDLIPGVEIIQANTDGVTVYMPREMEPLFNMWCKIWQSETLLNLEEVLYNKMWIRDCNNYISECM